MKRVKDYFSLTDGFFVRLKADNIEGYNELFGDYDPLDLECDFLSTCAERFVAPVVSMTENLSALAKMIYSRYNISWRKVKNTLFATYDTLKPYTMSTHTTNEISSENESSSNSNIADKIYGFNSQNAVDDSLKVSTDSANDTRSESSERTTIRTGNLGNITFSDLVLKEIETRKITFLALVMSDIKNYITLAIY